MLGGIIAGLGALAGGALGFLGSRGSNKTSASVANQQANIQREFAQNSIQWRVEDAKKAGLHPLAALGSYTSNYSPVSYNYDNGLAHLGQGVANASNAYAKSLDTAASKEQLRHLELQNLALERDIVWRDYELSQRMGQSPLLDPAGTQNGASNSINSVEPGFDLSRHAPGRYGIGLQNQHLQELNSEGLGGAYYRMIGSKAAADDVKRQLLSGSIVKGIGKLPKGAYVDVVFDKASGAHGVQIYKSYEDFLKKYSMPLYLLNKASNWQKDLQERGKQLWRKLWN